MNRFDTDYVALEVRRRERRAVFHMGADIRLIKQEHGLDISSTKSSQHPAGHNFGFLHLPVDVLFPGKFRVDENP